MQNASEKYVMKNIPERSSCPISTALDIFGDKWSLLIIRDILFEHKSSYKDFIEANEGISTNILADRLNALEAYGLIKKKRKESGRSKHIYLPTQQSIALIPVLTELILWGNKYYPNTNTHPESLLADLKADKANTIEHYGKKISSYLKEEE